MEELNMSTEIEIKRSMMRFYNDGDSERYVLLEAEHKEDIETETKKGRDEILWNAWSAISDNEKEKIDKLSGEKKFDAMCEAIDPERKLFQYVKWVKPTFDTDTFIFFNVRNCMDLKLEIFYAEEAVRHCARCYEPECIDIKDYMYQLLEGTIENQIDPLFYLGKRDPGQIIAGIRTDFEMNETGMDIIDFEVIRGIYTQDVSIFDDEEHVLFTLYIDPEEIEMCWNCREKRVMGRSTN